MLYSLVQKPVSEMQQKWDIKSLCVRRNLLHKTRFSGLRENFNYWKKKRFQLKVNFLKGKNPILKGKNPFLKGKNPFLKGKNPFLKGKMNFFP